MTLHTATYVVEKLNPFGEWTPLTMHYMCNRQEHPPTDEQINKAWQAAFTTAQSREKAGIKVRINTQHITVETTPVWEGR